MSKAFTLLELLVVITIIGILSSIVIVSMSGGTDSAEISKGKAYAQQIHALLGSEAVLDLNFNEGTYGTCPGGKDVCDTSGYGNHGVINLDGVEYVSSDIDGYALYFDGSSNDYVDCGKSSSWQNLTVKSVFLWVKPESFTGYYRYIYDGSYWSSPYGDFIILLNTSNTFTLGLKNTAGTPDYAYPYPAFTPDRWTFIGYSWNGTYVTYYKDGVVIETNPFTGTVANTARNLTFGKSGDGYYPFSGLMDEVRIYAKALATTEIQKLYVQGLERLLANNAITQSEYDRKKAELI